MRSSVQDLAIRDDTAILFADFFRCRLSIELSHSARLISLCVSGASGSAPRSATGCINTMSEQTPANATVFQVTPRLMIRTTSPCSAARGQRIAQARRGWQRAATAGRNTDFERARQEKLFHDGERRLIEVRPIRGQIDGFAMHLGPFVSGSLAHPREAARHWIAEGG